MMVISVSLNAMSIKHMMLSIKDNGAFFSNVLNFCFNFMFSVPSAHKRVSWISYWSIK